jgi:hypothetical protein
MCSGITAVISNIYIMALNDCKNQLFNSAFPNDKGTSDEISQDRRIRLQYQALTLVNYRPVLIFEINGEWAGWMKDYSMHWNNLYWRSSGMYPNESRLTNR